VGDASRERAERREPLGGEGEAGVVVTDTGSGIAEALGERVFEAFVTSHPDERDGFGLSVCHGIVTAFGGTLALAGTPGHGTTAVVRLPLA